MDTSLDRNAACWGVGGRRSGATRVQHAHVPRVLRCVLQVNVRVLWAQRLFNNSVFAHFGHAADTARPGGPGKPPNGTSPLKVTDPCTDRGGGARPRRRASMECRRNVGGRRPKTPAPGTASPRSSGSASDAMSDAIPGHRATAHAGERGFRESSEHTPHVTPPSSPRQPCTPDSAPGRQPEPPLCISIRIFFDKVNIVNSAHFLPISDMFRHYFYYRDRL
jgi:hypothetical protein